MLRGGHRARPPGGAVGLGREPGRFQFAFAQVFVLRQRHHHEAALTANRDGDFGFVLQRGFDGGDAADFEVVCVECIHGALSIVLLIVRLCGRLSCTATVENTSTGAAFRELSA